MRNEPTRRLGENFSYERKFAELAWLTGTNVQHGAFWFAEMHSLQYFQALSQEGKYFSTSDVKPGF